MHDKQHQLPVRLIEDNIDDVATITTTTIEDTIIVEILDIN